MTTRGEANSNPFNLEFGGIIWEGMADPPSDGTFCKFTADAWGLRAGFRDLYEAWLHDGLTTIEKLITHYAPPNENDTAAYIAAVSSAMNIDPATGLNLADAGQLLALGTSIITHENGECIYTASQLSEAVSAALA